MTFANLAKFLRLFFAATLIFTLIWTVLPASIVQAATITVNTTNDELNSDGDCSLREAIVAANTDTAVGACAAGIGADTIVLPAGTYIFSLTGSDDTANAGDLDITQDLTIRGAGAGNTTIEANGLDRVFEILNGSTLEISKVTIAGGNQTTAGSGIRVDGKLTLNLTRVRNNIPGGAIYALSGSSVTVINTRIQDNTGGGLYLQPNVTTLILNSTLSDNTSDSSGAGVNNLGSMTIVNSTISGNGADSSGGGIQNSGTGHLYNVTISNNTSGLSGTFGGGGGVSNSGLLTIRNSIIAGNFDNSAQTRPDCSGTLTGEGYNLVQNMTACTFSGSTTGNVTGVSANLGTLQNNGGPTFTHALNAGSPAINAGDPSGCRDQNNGLLLTDQRAYLRNGVCDMGAYEFSSPGTATATNTATAVNTKTSTITPTATRTPTLTRTPTRTSTATYTATPSPTFTNTTSPSPTATKTRTPTASATPTKTHTATPGPSPTSTQTPTVTATGSLIPTLTATVSSGILDQFLYLPILSK